MMFGNRFWSRNSLSDKKCYIKNQEHSDDFTIQVKKTKRSKLFERNINIFSKLRNYFVKAKSFDQNQSPSNKDKSSLKCSNEILSSKVSVKALKTSKLSLYRLFTSRKYKSMSISLSVDLHANECREIGNYSSSSRFSTLTDPEIDFKLNSSQTPKNNNRLNQNYIISYYGIVNHGNTCYINSILQCVNSIDSLAKYFVLNKFKNDLSRLNKFQNSDSNLKWKETTSFLFSFALFLKSLWMSNLKCETISSDFKAKLSMVDKNFISSDQQDAQEFLLFLLNYCHETLKLPLEMIDNKVMGNVLHKDRDYRKYNIGYEAQKISYQNFSKIHQLFATYQQLTITCPGCNTRQYKLEPHLCLSLPVPAKSMEPLYYCFVEKDGSQICAAMWINTVSLVQYVRANIAQKFRLNAKNILIMAVTESGYGKCYQDNESALELVSVESTSQSTTSNIWSGVVAIEIATVMNNNSSCQDYDSTDSLSYMTSLLIKQIKTPNSLTGLKIQSNNTNGYRQQSANYDNPTMEDPVSMHKSENQENSNVFKHSRHLKNEYSKYDNSNSNDNSINLSSAVNLVVIHVEEIIENSFVSGWRRFSAPIALLVNKEIEFLDMEKMILIQLETVYHCNIQSKLKLHLRFWVWDGLNNTDLEITNDHQFPLLTESVESIISYSENSSTIRILAVWSPNNSARLLQTIFASLRLSHSLGRDVSKLNAYSSSKCRSHILTLIDAWSAIEENGSVELVMRASLNRHSKTSESRNISLEDCLKAYMSEEVLDAKEAWKCPNCHTFQRATMSTSIYSLPEVLILHLKRFQSYSLIPHISQGKSFRDHEDIAMTTVGGNGSQNNNGLLFHENNSNNKLNILVDYPLSGLDMKAYLSNAAENDLKNQSSKPSENSEYFYDLIAVCNHQGTLSTGHYTAFCRSSVDYKWRLFNDEVVREISADKVIQPNAYILFYQQRSSIISYEQHWSNALNSSRSSLECQSTQSTLKSGTHGHTSHNNSNNNNTNIHRKSDPPKRRTFLTKRISDIKTSDCCYVSMHSNLRQPLPLDNNCNSLSNNTPILHDEDENENESESSRSSTSNENYFPTSVMTRPLRLRAQSTDYHSSKFPQTRI